MDPVFERIKTRFQEAARCSICVPPWTWRRSPECHLCELFGQLRTTLCQLVGFYRVSKPVPFLESGTFDGNHPQSAFDLNRLFFRAEFGHSNPQMSNVKAGSPKVADVIARTTTFLSGEGSNKPSSQDKRLEVFGSARRFSILVVEWLKSKHLSAIFCFAPLPM